MNKRMVSFLSIFVVAAFVLIGCNNTITPDDSAAFSPPGALAKSNNGIGIGAAKLIEVPGIVGVGNGLGPQGAPAVIVLAEAPGIAGIPGNVDGKSTIIYVTGKIYALGSLLKKVPAKKPPVQVIDPAERFDRPVPIGVSTGNAGECSAGTIGARVTNGANTFILSNNHVLALENNAVSGSGVLQPGRYDAVPSCATNAADVIGTLFDFTAISFIADNTIDAALALTSTASVGSATPSNGYGMPKSLTVPAVAGMKVQKYGRTTSLTRGTIDGVDFVVNVTYTGGTARFINQIVVRSASRKGGFILAGDSGSLLVTDPDREPVGLLFAGDTRGLYGIANNIDTVLSAFSITIDGE